MRSPADIIAALLRSQGLGSLPSFGEEWPLFTASLPDLPDKALVVYDTTPVLGPAKLDTGQTHTAYGIQVLVRSSQHTYSEGWAKVNAVADALDAVLMQAVAMDDADYLVHAVVRTSGPVSMGQDPEPRRQYQFSLNALATITVVA